jgi:hypothetical protein
MKCLEAVFTIVEDSYYLAISTAAPWDLGPTFQITIEYNSLLLLLLLPTQSHS